MNTKGYHKLIIWEKARELVLLIYKQTEYLPKPEEHGLKSQIRRAAVSVVLNIVEGHRRKSKKEFLRFLEMADSSLVETEACWELIYYLGFINEEKFDIVESKRKELAIVLNAFIRGLIRKKL